MDNNEILKNTPELLDGTVIDVVQHIGDGSYKFINRNARGASGINDNGERVFLKGYFGAFWVTRSLADIREIEELKRERDELNLKSCTLDLTKGHLSQCETALEERDATIESLRAQVEGLSLDNSELIKAGTMLSNIAYNLKQDKSIKADISKSLNDSQKLWDITVRQLNNETKGE